MRQTTTNVCICRYLIIDESIKIVCSYTTEAEKGHCLYEIKFVRDRDRSYIYFIRSQDRSYVLFDLEIEDIYFVRSQDRGTGNSRVKKPIYKTELRVVTSQTELLTRIFYFYYNNRVTNSRFLFQLKLYIS